MALINCGISLLNQECFSDAACYLEDALKLKTLGPDDRQEALCRLTDVYTALDDAQNLRRIKALQLEFLDEDRQENMRPSHQAPGLVFSYKNSRNQEAAARYTGRTKVDSRAYSFYEPLPRRYPAV